MARKEHKSRAVGQQTKGPSDDQYRRLLPTGGGNSCYIVTKDGRTPHVRIGSDDFWTYFSLVHDKRLETELSQLAVRYGGKWSDVLAEVQKNAQAK